MKMGLLVTAFYIAGFLCAAHAVLYTRTAQGAIAWGVSLVSFPFVAVPAYLVLGRDRFSGMLEALDDRREELDHVRDTFDRHIEPFRVIPERDPSWYQAVRELSGFYLTRGNRVELLVDGEATFDSILAGIAQAERYVMFQFYMIHDDGLGRRVKAALIERAQAGVAVRVLYDEVGSKGLPEAWINELEAAGAEVSSFRPTQGAWNRFQLNFRNHRKMVVVDGRVGWVGGHNVGDEYLGLDPEFSPWRDTHVRIEGPAVMQMQAAQLADWYWATRDIPELEWQPQPADPDRDGQMAMVLPTAPTSQMETASLLFISALSSAEKRIWISAPYFVPDEGVLKALALAALRGVDVRIITTGKGDSLPVYLAAFHFIEKLRGLGIRFYAYSPGFLHQKAMLVDDSISSVGTHNFDNRSFRLNFEVTAITVDEAFAEEVAAMFERDFEHSEMIDPDTFSDKPLYWRLGVQLSRLAAPVL